MTEKLLDVCVVWSLDGQIMTTLLQFEDDDMSRQARQQWSPQDYVVQACDAEFPDEENYITNGHSYELVAIFSAENIHFIF